MPRLVSRFFRVDDFRRLSRERRFFVSRRHERERCAMNRGFLRVDSVLQLGERPRVIRYYFYILRRNVTVLASTTWGLGATGAITYLVTTTAICDLNLVHFADSVTDADGDLSSFLFSFTGSRRSRGEVSFRVLCNCALSLLGRRVLGCIGRVARGSGSGHTSCSRRSWRFYFCHFFRRGGKQRTGHDSNRRGTRSYAGLHSFYGRNFHGKGHTRGVHVR